MAIFNTWVTDSNVPVLAAQYSDGEVISHYATNSGFSTISYNSSSSPDERGVKWVQPFNGVIYWVWLNVAFSSLTSDADIVIYNDQDGALSTTSLQPDFCTAASLTSLFLKVPIPRVLIREGYTYRITLKPTTTENITVNSMTYLDQASRENTFGFGHLTTRADGGAWTDTLTEAMQITPIIGSMSIGRSMGNAF